MEGDSDNPFAEVLAAHKKNIEALTRANQVAISGFQAVARRQMEFMQQAMSEAAAIAEQSGAAHNVREAVAKQAIDQSIAHMRELADMLQQTNREAVDVVNQRIAESLAELKQAAPKG